MIYRGSGFIVLMVLLICPGCGGRDTSTPAKALIGHWRFIQPDRSSYNDTYIRPDGSIIGFFSRTPGEYFEGNYKVVRQDTVLNTVETSMQKDDGTWEKPQTYFFSKDFTEMGKGDDFVLKYVDAKLEP